MVHAYATGVFSSRKIAKKLHEDVAFRVLAADNFPAHRTIRHKAMSYSHMLKAEAELKAQIDALLKWAQQADDAEKNAPELNIPAGPVSWKLAAFI
jgi:hypothetical protein